MDGEGDGDDDPTDHQERQPGLQEPHEAAGHEKDLQTSCFNSVDKNTGLLEKHITLRG